MLGDEAFYTVALPLSAWVLDLELTRRLAFFWASMYYVGQATKVKWERYILDVIGCFRKFITSLNYE